MLVVTRTSGQRIRIALPGGATVWVIVVETDRGKVRLGIEAPQEVQIDRGEVWEEKAREKR